MNKITMFGIAALACTTVIAAPAKAPKKIHVPETLDSLRVITPAAKTENHILLVNVGQAVSEKDWPLVTNFAVSRIQINAWTNSIAETVFPTIVTDRSIVTKKFGEKAKVVVFFENSDCEDNYQAAPGAWCRVNLKYLKKDNPDRQTLLDRMAKAVLKGIATASGCGAGYDNMSVTGAKTMTLEGLDAAGICITPEAYFPMLECLKIVGGDKILAPAVLDVE